MKLNIAAVRSSGHTLSRGLVLSCIYDSAGETYFGKVETQGQDLQWKVSDEEKGQRCLFFPIAGVYLKLKCVISEPLVSPKLTAKIMVVS